jgi:hypothetical protein
METLNQKNGHTPQCKDKTKTGQDKKGEDLIREHASYPEVDACLVIRI